MATPDSDPRVFFAAERTLLAWIRTGLTIIAIGFMVAKFGLFVRLLSWQFQSHVTGMSTPLSTGLGTAFVLVGSITVFVSAVQHGRFIATLPPHDLPHAYSRKLAVALSFIVAVLGLALAGYLLLTTN